jgi:hypothetical protein
MHLSDNHNPLQNIQLSKANELVLNYIQVKEKGLKTK